MNLSELVKHLMKHDKQWLLELARTNDENSIIYLDECKEAPAATKQEYDILHFFAKQGIFSEEPIVSERGGTYSLFKITEQGKHYFREHKLRTD